MNAARPFALAALLAFALPAAAQRTGGSFGGRAWGSRPSVSVASRPATSRPAARFVWTSPSRPSSFRVVSAPTPRPRIVGRRVSRPSTGSWWVSVPSDAGTESGAPSSSRGGCGVGLPGRGASALLVVLLAAVLRLGGVR